MRGQENSLIRIRRNFVRKLDNGCWFWKGAIGSNGYGQVHYKKKHWHAHRLFWILIKGPIIPFQQIHHTCGCRLCVNPEYMTLLSVREHGIISNRKRYSK